MQEIAEVYARSLFEVAKEHDVLDDIHDQLDEFADALNESRDLQVFFFSPYFSSEEKKDAIGKVVSGGDDHFVRFLELLAKVDADVLGGLAVQVGNSIMDGTVRARLNRLRRQVATAA